MMLLTVYWALVAFALIILLMTALLNALTFPRIRLYNSPTPTQDIATQDETIISILIPARNEAAVIHETIRAHCASPMLNLEIILLDDGSTDGTAQVALDAAQGDPRFRIINGTPLPPGWLGKNWACHQLSEAASGDRLIFSDADVQWGPGAHAALLETADHHQADMLSVWSTQRTETPAERLVVPLMALAIIGYLPEIMVRFSPLYVFAAANGQVLLFRRAAYDALGGHASVKDKIVEDVTLARNTKKLGRKLVMVDGSGRITCRMYQGWSMRQEMRPQIGRAHV
jgi:chlorobactene glucosyltransferase